MNETQDVGPGPQDIARAERIRQLKRERGWTWERLADEVGVKQPTVETWGSRTKAVKPTWPHLAKLAQVLDVTPAWLETGDNHDREPADPVQTLGHDVDQLRGRVTQIDQQIRFIAENRAGITRLEAAAEDVQRQLETIRELLHEQAEALADLLQERVAAQTEALADRRATEGSAPASGERRTSRGRRLTDP